MRKQHEQRLKEFLVDELHVCTEREVKERIYFVSSREVRYGMLRTRLGHVTRIVQYKNLRASCSGSFASFAPSAVRNSPTRFRRLKMWILEIVVRSSLNKKNILSLGLASFMLPQVDLSLVKCAITMSFPPTF